MPDLLDADVWVPLSAADHVDHARARRYWEQEADETIVFCRITALALLRHLSNPRIMGPLVMDGRAAWEALGTWLAQPHVRMLAEPADVDEWLGDWSGKIDVRGGAWTDAYLAAFAVAKGCRFVSFDGGFSRFRGLELLHLKAQPENASR